MGNPEGGSHPVLERVHTLQDAVYLSGLGDALDLGKVNDGKIRGYFTPWDDADPSYPISQLDVFDTITGLKAVFAFAPPQEIDNPMQVIEFDDENPDEQIVVPVLARILLQSDMPLTIIDSGSKRVAIKDAMVHFTQDLSILSFDESTELPVVKGSFDGSLYRSIGKFLNRYSPLQDLLQFVEAQD